MLRLTLAKAEASPTSSPTGTPPNVALWFGRPFARAGGHLAHGHGQRCGGCFQPRDWVVGDAEVMSPRELKEQHQQHPRCRKNLPQTRTDARHPHELTLTMHPYGGAAGFICDGCQLAGRRMSYHCAQCQFDLHVDCEKAKAFHEHKNNNPWQRRQQWFRLHNQALKKMEKNKPKALEKARELLKHQLELSVHHRATPLYNLACVESLCGALEESVNYLREAVAAGWTDFEHLKADKDLDNIRELDGYKELIAASVDESNEKTEEEAKEDAPKAEAEEKTEITGESQAFAVASPPPYAVTAPIPPSTPTPVEPAVQLVPNYAPSITEKELNETPAPAPAPAQPTSPPALSESKSAVAEFDEKLSTLEEMGWNDRRKNITTLVRTHGDLVAAVQVLLEEAGTY